MQSSGTSSQASTSPSQSLAGPTHKRFSLDGRSHAVNPRVDAVRRDLADVRLAGRVFAPHYAAPLPRRLAVAADLRAAPAADSEVLASLKAGDVFEVLELAGDRAWGVAPGVHLVGYIAAETLGEQAA